MVPKRQLPNLSLLKFLATFPTEGKYLRNSFTIVRLKMRFTKYIDSQTNKKYPDNDGPTTGFCKHFSNDLSPALRFRW